MHTDRFPSGLMCGLCRWIAVVFAVFGLSACGTSGASAVQTIPATLPGAVATPRSTPTAPLATVRSPSATDRSTPTALPAATLSPNAADAWKTYRSDRAGYTIDYPADWKIDERIEPNGADMTTFSSATDNSGMSIAVIVQNGAPADQEIPDMPNTRCQQVTVGGLTGTRCFDTIAFSMTTTIVTQGKTYILAGSRKHLDQNIYQHFLSSWTIKS